MKRFIFLSVAFASMCLSISSCKKCYTCDFGNAGVATYCTDDFPDKNAGLKMTIDAYRDQGYTCNPQ